MSKSKQESTRPNMQDHAEYRLAADRLAALQRDLVQAKADHQRAMAICPPDWEAAAAEALARGEELPPRHAAQTTAEAAEQVRVLTKAVECAQRRHDELAIPAGQWVRQHYLADHKALAAAVREAARKLHDLLTEEKRLRDEAGANSGGGLAPLLPCTWSTLAEAVETFATHPSHANPYSEGV